MLQFRQRIDVFDFFAVGFDLFRIEVNLVRILFELNFMETVDWVFHRFSEIIETQNFASVQFRYDEVAQLLVTEGVLCWQNLDTGNKGQVKCNPGRGDFPCFSLRVSCFRNSFFGLFPKL